MKIGRRLLTIGFYIEAKLRRLFTHIEYFFLLFSKKKKIVFSKKQYFFLFISILIFNKLNKLNKSF